MAVILKEFDIVVRGLGARLMESESGSVSFKREGGKSVHHVIERYRQLRGAREGNLLVDVARDDE